MAPSELDPAYFDPDEWERRDDGEDGTLYAEYYINETTGQRVTPERYHELVHNAQVIEDADVVTRDKLRRLIDHFEARADENKRKGGSYSQNSFYDGIVVGRNRSASDLSAVGNGEIFDDR